MAKMTTLVGALGALLGAGAATVAVAAQDSQSAPATISLLEGSVLVSRDNGIVPGAEGMELQALNRVFVLEDSQATVTFQDGCEQKLPANAMLTITESGTCVPDPDVVSRSATSQGKVYPKGEIPFVAAPAAAAPATVAAAGVPTGVLVAAGLLAAGGIAWAIVDDDDDDERPRPIVPISPQ